jgi:hypothetical protein
MAKTYLGALSSLFIQAIGLMFMGYYFILTVISGQFFKKPTAEYKSELALGKLLFFLRNSYGTNFIGTKI